VGLGEVEDQPARYLGGGFFDSYPSARRVHSSDSQCRRLAEPEP
jgi:hypothetical protein